MSIKTGRYGTVKWDAAPASPENPVEIASLNSWKLSEKTDYSDVTCFGDTNKVWVPGLPDFSGTLGGFWNSDNVVLFAAVKSPTPGFLSLAPNSTESSFKFEGLAYMDADIDCTIAVPKVSGTFKAAGPWNTPG
ncbi:MAG: hypothetical protein V4597_08565 [Pseudomonadota bacterium]